MVVVKINMKIESFIYLMKVKSWEMDKFIMLV